MSANEDVFKPFMRQQIHEDFVGGLISMGRFLFSASEDGELLVTDLEKESISPLLEDKDPLNYLVFFQEEILLAGCDDGKIYCYHITDREGDHVLEGLDDSGVRKMAVSFDGKVIAGTNSGQIGIWSHALSSEPPLLFDVHNGATVNAVCVHPSRPLAATSGMDGLTLIWDLNAKQVIRELEPVKGTFISGIAHYGASQMVWNEDYLFVGKEDVHVYNVNFEKIKVLDGFSFAIDDLALHDTTLYALGVGIKTWEIHSWKEGPAVAIPLNGYSMALSASGNLLFVGLERGIIYGYHTAEWMTQAVTVEHHGKLKNTLQTEEYIFTAAEDRQIIVWDAQGQFLFKIKSQHNYVALVTFHEGELIYFDDGKLHWYRMEVRRVVRSITVDVFILEEALQIGEEVFITSVGNYPLLLDLKSKTVSEIPYRFALYHMQQLGDQLFFSGYASFALEPEDHPHVWDEVIEPGHTPNEVPVVQYDLRTRSFVKEYWLEERRGFGPRGGEKPKIYPTSFALDGEDLLVGYVHGKVAKWKVGADQPASLKAFTKDYTLSLVRNAAGNYLASMVDIVLFDSDLVELGRLQQGNSMAICHYDPAQDLLIAYQHYNYILYFIDASTLEVLREEKIPSFVDEIVQIGQKFMVFCQGKLVVFRWEGR